VTSLDLRKLGETGLIEVLRRRAGSEADARVLGIGDDAARLRASPGCDFVTSVDALVEDVHFRWSTTDPRSLGIKALEVNLSDLAAMGATPRGFLLSWVLPDSTSPEQLSGIVSGLLASARRAKCPLLGGDTVSGPKWMLSITVFGEVRRGRALLRSSLRPRDRILVTGSLGGAALGLACLEGGAGCTEDPSLRPYVGRQLRPRARLEAGIRLAKQRWAGAAMDLSDGIALDLARMCAASGVAARIDLDRLPAQRNLRRVCAQKELDAERLVLAGGEDYELLFSVRPAAPAAAEIGRQLGCKVTEIGEARAGRGVHYWCAGSPRVVEWQGYEHFKRIAGTSDK